MLGWLWQTGQKLVAGGVTRSHDLTGIVFQRLIADRKFLAFPLQANLTGGEEAAGPEGFDWLDSASGITVDRRNFELGFSKRFVKDEGVGDDRHRHASRLSFLVVRLAKHAPNLRAELTFVGVPASELLCC